MEATSSREEYQRGKGEASYCGHCLAKTVKRCSARLVYILWMRQYFVNAKLLLAPIFCWCLTFVDANILSTLNFCRRQYFENADILWSPTFCQRLTFVDANILRTPIFVNTDILSTSTFVDANILSSLHFCRRWYFVDAYLLHLSLMIVLCIFVSWLLLICLNLLWFPPLDTCRSLFRAQ